LNDQHVALWNTVCTRTTGLATNAFARAWRIALRVRAAEIRVTKLFVTRVRRVEQTWSITISARGGKLQPIGNQPFVLDVYATWELLAVW
jgi:hypothetical protein